MIFREILNFIFVFIFVFTILNLARFLYGLWPVESFVVLTAALMYAVYRLFMWLLSAGAVR